MERRGVYRKGSAGHVRNASPYRLRMEHAKRFKFPIVGMLAIALIFGMAPLVGDEFQASLLTADQMNSISAENPQHVKKVLLDSLNSFVKDCSKYKIESCVKEGGELIHKVAVSGKDVVGYVPLAESFASNYEQNLAIAFCKYDLGNSLITMKSVKEKFDELVTKYGDVFPESMLISPATNLAASMDDLNKLVHWCIQQ
ncbi:MAG: hypothetical protein AAB606_02680 [Patescibacteria group bacterium]